MKNREFWSSITLTSRDGQQLTTYIQAISIRIVNINNSNSFLVSKMVCSSVVNLMLSTNLCKNYPSRTRSYKHIDITIGSIAPLGLQYILNLLHHDFRITKHTTP